MKKASHGRTNTVWFHSHEVSGVVRFIETESGRVVARGCGQGERGVQCLRGTAFWFGKMMGFLKMDGGDGYTTMSMP